MSATEFDRTAENERVEALARLADGAGHDFSNLLTIMMMNLGFLEDAPGLPPECHRAARDALGAAERAAKLSERLRAFSRRQDLAPRTIKLRDWLASIEEDVKSFVGPDVEVQVSLEDNVWDVFADPKALQNAVGYLVTNAREAMPETDARLAIHAANAVITSPDAVGPNPGEDVLLTIADNGGGMSEQTAAHALEPFYSTKQPRTGYGLGLSIVDGFARQSGGRVEIRSALGDGTTVTLHLPRARRQAAAGAGVSRTAEPATPAEPQRLPG